MPVFQRTTVRVPRDLKPITTIARDAETAAPKAGLANEDAKAIWLALKALYRSGAYPAIGFCLRRNGQVLFDRTIGHAEGQGPGDGAAVPKRLLTPTTPVCLFSASKAVTAVLIHQLAEQGGIDLDQRVSHYLPKFARAGKSDTTVADVLAHRGGFPSMDVPKSQRQLAEARRRTRNHRRVACRGAQQAAVFRRELPELDQQRRAPGRERRVPRADRTAQIAAGRVRAELVLEHAVEHQDLLAAAMRVRREARARRVAHDARRARHFIAVAFEPAAQHAGLGRGAPGHVLGPDHDAAPVVGMQLHAAF
ncbi:MAG: hypothetical protein NVS9B10_19870 [Nevskia sp.]